MESANPGCIVVMIDQSGSMGDPFGGKPGTRKCDEVARVTNNLLTALVKRCVDFRKEKKDMIIKTRYYIYLVGYGARGENPYLLVGNGPLTPAELDKALNDTKGNLIQPIADNGTPMCAAFRWIAPTLQNYCNDNRSSHPPIVINITDGEMTDGGPDDFREAVKGVTDLRTDHGHALVYSFHISDKAGTPILFPSDQSQINDEFALLLYEVSSYLTWKMIRNASPEQQTKYGLKNGCKGYVFNADKPEILSDFLSIGTLARAPSSQR